MEDLVCVDLFCGAGGLSCGLHEAGIRVAAGVDYEQSCGYPYQTNNGGRFLCADIRNLAPRVVAGMFGNARIRFLAGCPPCQPFSSYAQRYDKVGTPEWRLLSEFGRMIEALRPEIVAMENVPGVVRHSVFTEFVADLLRYGYHVDYRVVDCSLYGLPQRRRRTILMASLLGEISIAPPSGRIVTVREAIGHLPPVAAGETHPDDPLHRASGLSELSMRRVMATPPGGSWVDWPVELLPDRYRRPSGQSFKNVYSRMVWDEPSATLTTRFTLPFSGPYIHPEQHRGLTLREGAILQGFPNWYRFVPDGSPVVLSKVARMIGNAVPPLLGYTIGRSVLYHLNARRIPT